MIKLNPNKIIFVVIVVIIACTTNLRSDDNSGYVKSLFKAALEKQLKMPADSKIYLSQYNYISSELKDSTFVSDTSKVTMYISSSRILFMTSKMISLQNDSLLFTIVPPKKMIIVMNYDKNKFISHNMEQQWAFYSKLLDSSGKFSYRIDSLTDEITVLFSDSTNRKDYDYVNIQFKIFDDEILNTDINYLNNSKIVGLMTTKMIMVNRNYNFTNTDENQRLFLANDVEELVGISKFKGYRVFDNRKNNNKIK